MEYADVTSLVTAGDFVPFEENLPRPSTYGTYESFESFMIALAPSVELPCTDNASILSEITSSIPGMEEAAAHCANAEAFSTPEEEVKHLKDLVALLQVRLDATAQVAEIQEKELCREMGGDEEMRSNYERLLTRWRREVCILLLKQRVDALQVEQRTLQQTQKEQHLTVQLHEARALVEVLKQKERNLQAEIGILTTGQKLAEMTMRAEAARRQHEVEGTVKGVTRGAVEALCSYVEEHSAIMFHQLELLAQASCRLDLCGQRLRFSEQQVMMVINNAFSDGKSSGTLTSRKRIEETINIEKPRSVGRKRDRAQPSVHVLRRPVNDHTGRANQLEVLLSATKAQLTEECMHARELQERLGKIESEGRDAVKRASRKAQDQAERDLVAIKRQHSQVVQSLQQRISKLQNEHAKSLLAQHQLERRLSQQQQEFVYTLNQRDNEFRKSLDAKEIEVNGLLDEQNALLNKLKNFWRPILNSSSAKLFTEKGQRAQLQTPRATLNVRPQESKSEEWDQFPPNIMSVQTQTVVGDVKKKSTKPDDSEEPEQASKERKEHKDRPESRQKKTEIQSLSRLSTPGRKDNKHEGQKESKVKRSEDDLISTYLNKLQKSYVTSNKQHSHHREDMHSRTLKSLLEEHRNIQSSPSTSLPNRQDQHGNELSESRPIPRQSLEYPDAQSTHGEALPHTSSVFLHKTQAPEMFCTLTGKGKQQKIQQASYRKS